MRIIVHTVKNGGWGVYGWRESSLQRQLTATLIVQDLSPGDYVSFKTHCAQVTWFTRWSGRTGAFDSAALHAFNEQVSISALWFLSAVVHLSSSRFQRSWSQLFVLFSVSFFFLQASSVSLQTLLGFCGLGAMLVPKLTCANWRRHCYHSV